MDRVTNVTRQWRSLNHCCGEKALSIKYYKCVSVFLPWLCGMKIVSFLRWIILSSVSCPVLPHVSTLSHKWHDFRKKKYWTKSLCVDFLLQLLFESFLILQRIMQDVFMYLNILHVQYQLFFSHFHGTRIFSTYFREFLKHRISWKAVQWEQLLHADGRTDREACWLLILVILRTCLKKY